MAGKKLRSFRLAATLAHARKLNPCKVYPCTRARDGDRTGRESGSHVPWSAARAGGQLDCRSRLRTCRKLLQLLLPLLATLLFAGDVYAASYPIIAYGTRTYVAETTKTNGRMLVRIYRRMGSNTWQRYGGFSLPAEEYEVRRAKVNRDPQSATASERVYFTGRIIGSTPFQPSSPLYQYRTFRNR